MVPIYQKGRYGEIDYQGGVGMAGLILLSKVCGVVVSAEQSGAVQFFLWISEQNPANHQFDKNQRCAKEISTI